MADVEMCIVTANHIYLGGNNRIILIRWKISWNFGSFFNENYQVLTLYTNLKLLLRSLKINFELTKLDVKN